MAAPPLLAVAEAPAAANLQTLDFRVVELDCVVVGAVVLMGVGC
jgi:hypothetical protein